MYILGINAYYHDTSAALIRDGKLVCAVEEERFTRIKHSPNAFPYKAIEFCLNFEGIKLTDIDHIAYYMDQSLIAKEFWKFQPYFSRMWMQPWKFFGGIYLMRQKDKLAESLGKKANAKVHFIKHHMAHAASAFYGSNFKKASVLTIDGRGELISSQLAQGNGSEIEVIDETPLPHSLGVLYAAVTDFLNFRPNDGEGKVMGLAPYGKPKYVKQFQKMVWETEKGFKTDPSYYWGFLEGWGTVDQKFYTQKMVDVLGKPRVNEPAINGRNEHIAASIQEVTEQIGIHMAKVLYEKTGNKNLCLAGGVALNAKMNGLIYQQDFVDDLYVMPAATDSGTAIGAAFYVYNQLTGKRPSPVEDIYTGGSYTDDEIKKTLDKCKVKYEKYSDIAGTSAELLAKNKIFGWFQGRMELGPRALGCRSILAAPGSKQMLHDINFYVKNRELWRPFALSMRYEDKEKYLEHGFNSPFMILIDKVPDKVQKDVIAGVHVDGTTRPQTLIKKYNPLYYKLMSDLGKHTGTPVVLNTSFNLAGEPIVNTPSQAIADFFGSGMDYLAIGSYLVRK